MTTTTEEWKYKGKMEGMEGLELKERIQKAMDFEIKDKIQPVPYLGKTDIIVKHRYLELVARCPVTGILDLYTIVIKYIPNKWIPELKSLKFYYMGYDQLPISHEHLLAKVFGDFKKVIKPKWLKITLSVAIRGGIKTIVEKEEKFNN